MAFTIKNQTGSTIGPYNGVSILAGNSYTVNDPVGNFAKDPTLQSDVLNNTAFISIGSVDFGGLNALNLLFEFVELDTKDYSNVQVVYGALSISTTPVHIKVGASNLVNRKAIDIFNNSNSTLYYGYDASVTTSTGMPLFGNQFSSFKIGENINLYIVASSGTHDIRISEFA